MMEMSNMKSTTQNLFPENSQRLNSSIPQATDLFMSGLHWLKVLAEKDQEIRFSRWAKLIRDARGTPENLNLKYLEWLWNAITSEVIWIYSLQVPADLKTSDMSCRLRLRICTQFLFIRT
jgi:hypothetical protein